MRQFFARLTRHQELEKEREQVRRLRLGHATAMLMNMWRSGNSAPLEASDVFPDLRETQPEVLEDDDEAENARGILQMFKMMAAGQKVHSA